MNQRIKNITEAATLLFLRQGYAKTQISHIAKEVGVSVGTIYLDFTGKEAIMHFILKCSLDPHFIEQEFERPITNDLFAGVEDEIINLFEDLKRDFTVRSQSGMDDCDLETFISDIFDMMSKYAVGCLFIEKNQFDFKILAQHYRTFRESFFKMMTHCIATFITKGMVRPLEHLELTTLLIIEILSWWAMDIRYTSFETKDIPSDLAKKICLDNILSAYKA